MSDQDDKQGYVALNIRFDPDFLELIDDWRFANRFPTRNAAIRWALKYVADQKIVVPREGRRRQIAS